MAGQGHPLPLCVTASRIGASGSLEARSAGKGGRVMPHETSATKFGLRPVVYGRRGMVATANPLATLAGVRMLAAGGNAVDAIVAAAAAIGVAEPYMSGLAGCGTLVLTPPGEAPRVLMFLGRAAGGATPDRFTG